MGTRSALRELPNDVVKIPQRPVADDPFWLNYRYVNSIACLNGTGSSLLDSYDFLLRTDVDVFLTPAWKAFHPPEFTTGTGGYVNDQCVRDNIQRIANKFGMKHRGVVNIGSTLYGPTSLIKEVCEVATELCKYIRTVEFGDDQGAWPSWYHGVSSLYATEIAVNHLVPSFAAPSKNLDFESTSDGSVYDHPHIHCWHTDRTFSKFKCFDGVYDRISESELNLSVIRDYCTAMALRARRGQEATARARAPSVPGRTVASKLAAHLWNAGERTALAGWKLRAEGSRIARHATPLLDAANFRRRRAVRDWLVHCADPLGSMRAPPRRALSPKEAHELVAQADKHGVLPALLRHFPPFRGDAAFAAAKADALARHRSKLTYSLMLRTHGEALMSAAAGLPVVMVKGPVFSRTIYPLPGLRNFTDIDLLIAPEAEPQLARVLEQQGFRLAEYDRDPGRQEWKWLHRGDEALMIEVHTNLVHHPELREAMSLTYEDVAGIAETPAALLTVALVHGAMERYELVRHVVDVCQAARRVDTAEEERRFETLVQKTGARLAAVAGLDLAYRLLAEPRCRELASRAGPARYTALARLLLGRSTITSTMGNTRYLHSWRRQGFRVLLKRGGAL